MSSSWSRWTALFFLGALLVLSGCQSRSKAPATFREIAPGHGLPALLIDVPGDYRLDPRKGADFELYYFQREKTEKGEPPRDGLGIYIGPAPSFSPPKDAQTVSGTIAGQRATWYTWEDDSADRTILRMQTVLPNVFAGKAKAGEDAGLKVHVFLWAPGEKRLGILRDAAESLRLKP